MSLASIIDTYKRMREHDRPVDELGAGGYVEGTSSVGTAPERGVDPFPWGRPLPRTPAWQFTAADHVVFSSRPVVIALSRGEQLFFAENENLGIVATGRSVLDAVEDFGEQLVESYLHYRRLGWNDVTGRAVELKRFFEDFFSEARVAGED
jgi:hypothetical protein